jgi:hypothetical protein
MNKTTTQAPTAKKPDSTQPKKQVDPPKIPVGTTKVDPPKIPGGTTQGDPPRIIPGE